MPAALPTTLRHPTRRELVAAQRAALRARRDERREASRNELRRRLRSTLVMLAVCVSFLVAFPTAAWAAAGTDVHPFIQLALYLGGLSLLPFAVMTLTSFLRIVIVLSFLRSGLGAQNVPPNMVIIALALFLSLFVMGPTLDQINKDALQPYQSGKIKDFNVAIGLAQQPLKQFMVKQVNGKNSVKEVSTFYKLAREQDHTPCRSAQATDGCLITPDQYSQLGKNAPMALPMRVVIPAFIISELKKAFIMGFAVLLPFLVIDMVISNILLSLGMFMLPPVVISLPFKILLFVLAGGWTMVVEFLVKGFNY